MKIPKMNIMSKKNKKQNAELIERLNEIQSQLNEIKTDAGIEETEFTFTREQLENFLVEYTNKVNQYIFDEVANSLDSDEIVTVDVDGREITTYVDEDKLRDAFIEATESVETSTMMEYAEDAMSEVGVN
jgi:very-short-patch-repair endonuclease